MIKLALIVKDKPRYYYSQFLSLIKESDEFTSIFVDIEKDKMFEIIPVYKDHDLTGLAKSTNFYPICNGLYIDRRSIPEYIAPWEEKKLKSIMDTYLSIAFEDLGFKR